MDNTLFNYIKSKVDDFFCINNLKDIYKDKKYNFSISFVEFMMCIEDFYTFVYSTRLSKNGWLLFTWLRTLVRYDGYVTLSYKDISNKFNMDEKSIISKPTFFKCISELESYGLVKRLTNKKTFYGKYQNESNTYIVVSKVKEIVQYLDGMEDMSCFYNTLRKNFFVDNESKDNNNVKKADKKTDYYALLLKEYKKITNVISDYFEHLGSGNKTGKISFSRKNNISKYLLDCELQQSDLSYCLEQTISKGVSNEKYTYAIIRNIRNEQPNSNTKTELQKKYTKTYISSNTNNGMSKESFDELLKLAFRSRNAYKTVLQRLWEQGILKKTNKNVYEDKIIRCCNLLKKKAETLKTYRDTIWFDRNKILEKYNIWEEMIDTKYLDQKSSFVYADSGEKVPLSKVIKIAKKHKDVFVYGKYQINILQGRI